MRIATQPAIASASGQAGAEWGGAIRLVILGQPVALKNNYVLLKPKGHRRTFMMSNSAVKRYQQSAAHQVPIREPLLTGKLSFSATLFYRTNRPDLDAEAIYDALQGRIYKNDRQLREKHLKHAIDKNNPRAEILIEPLQAEIPLPAMSKKCRDGQHLISIFVREFIGDDGEQYSVGRCKCGFEQTAPSMAAVRSERGMDW